MLNPEVAKERLEGWLRHEIIGDEDAQIAVVAKLPAALRAAGYAIVGRDARGRELSVDWHRFDQYERRRAELWGELDELKAGERVRVFGAFCPRLAEHVEMTWQFLKATPYQHGHHRRSFRAPRHPRASLANRGKWCADLVGTMFCFQPDVVTSPWLAAWAPHLQRSYGGGDVVGRLLAAVIDGGGPAGDEVFDILAQSLRNEHEIGMMGRHVTRALLSSSRPDGWELIEKTLLAAQRQEGLRQVILETVDEAHPQAFRRMLRLIIEHDLVRFSAVARAADVWFGYQWESASVKQINDTIARALKFLDDEEARAAALAGKNAEDAFLALWAIAFDNAPASIPHAAKLLKHGSPEHRFVAALHLTRLELEETNPVRQAALADNDLRVASCALAGFTGSEGGDLFESLERLYQRIPTKPPILKPLVWPWMSVRPDRTDVASPMIQALGERPATRLLPYLEGFHPRQRRFVVELLSAQKKWDRLTRDTLLDLAGDTSSDVRQAAMTALAKGPVQRGEAERLEGLLTRKTSDLRRGVIGLLGAQKDAEALASVDRLTAAKDGQQRLAGLEILRQLAEADRARKQCQERAQEYSSTRKSLTNEEQTQINAIEASGRERLTLDDALGLCNPAERSPIVPPKNRQVPFITDAAIACLKSLDEFIHAHRETPLSLRAGGPEVLLGTIEWGFPTPDWGEPLEKCKEALPLRERWEQWSDARPKALRDKDGFELVRGYAWADLEDWDWDDWKELAANSKLMRPIVRTLSGGQQPVKLKYHRLVSNVLQWLIYLRPTQGAFDYLLDVADSAFALVPPDLNDGLTRSAENDFDEIDQDELPTDWRESEPFELWINLLQQLSTCGTCPPQPEQWSRYWRLMHWRDQPLPAARRFRPPLELLKEAYAEKAATLADWYDQLLGPRPSTRYGSGFGELQELTSPGSRKDNEPYFRRFPEIRELVDRCRERILAIELARGEEVTPATSAALDLGSLNGAATLLRILISIGKNGFKLPSRWGNNQVGRIATLTHLASITYPIQTDTPADFVARFQSAVKDGTVPEERLLELAFLAPQWVRHVEAYFDWPGLSEGLYWFLGHLKYASGAEQAATGAGFTEETKEEADGSGLKRISAWERLILGRTPLTDEERRSGAVDVAWFQKTYAQLTPKRWEALASAARFAATPTQAKRAQFIGDVLLGKASRKELVTGIRGKKLKEYVRLLGLLPLATGAKRDADLRERYQVLQEYRRYAKQLSAMTKDDAMRSVDVGMQNLARTSGYPDPLRLEWAMEADSVKDLAKGAVAIKRQSSRMRQSLENAACRGDSFTGVELGQLAGHAILAPLLNRLVLVGDGILGYPDKNGKALRDYRGKLEPVKKTEELRLAHPHDLLATGNWEAWQRECFQAERVQPFKQVFRELYVVTKQEKTDGTASRRYAGQQVNQQQAFALWGQRGWQVRDGVWKTHHDLGITAAVGFNYGATTPLEVEGLTIETVTFFRRDAGGAMKLVDVPPRTFSETMRDLDLVVSVAHRGGVDPEASASTVEMRASLLRETCQLVQLKNVRFKANNALIDGALAKYSIHLGSGVVHKLPGGALCIVPVHAQHRGRLFLPFADDDPKTAEVIAKVLLLARDQEIQDPTILEQLR